MATITFPHSSFSGCAVEFDVLTSNWKVSQIRCINNSEYPAKGLVYELGELIFEAIAPAGQTTSWNVVGVQLGWQPDTWNVDEQKWEPGGIDMGDYVLAIQFPAEVP